jgi:hypothetical protein
MIFFKYYYFIIFWKYLLSYLMLLIHLYLIISFSELQYFSTHANCSKFIYFLKELHH